MNGDTPDRAIKEAEGWLASARHSLAGVNDGDAPSSVCCAQGIHAIIRANDALCLKFLGVKITRHDDAAAMFAKLLKLGKLPDGAQDFKDTIADAMRDKSGADYGKSLFTEKNAEKYVQRAEEFIAMAKNALGA